MGPREDFPPGDGEGRAVGDRPGLLKEERAADAVGDRGADRLHAGLHAARNPAVHTGTTHLSGGAEGHLYLHRYLYLSLFLTVHLPGGWTDSPVEESICF